MLLDSNIIIYSAQPEYSQLRELIAEHSPAVSALSYLEVLGYHLLTKQQREYFEELFRVAQVLPISQDVLTQAVALRQQRRMTLGDAIIAGTALAHKLTLITRNVDDFRWVAELNLLNPFDADGST
ncbi:MAG: type II toxin-antitoxin system VapC family toxin [Leptolyngbyaceae cyanobacterium RM2_2_4]|nr:type II toxin-antitoxin system VapC family toxin [Leptolyngbyaceae cyanobacterium SM1_4_3]NJN59735.1 type II toxin-antitoxin system VapC family toxin [Leptolyngbyaceae cyanobacterium SL_5_9]NJO48678.1 type II toxin-antitoxin system VapC family toxin [Leptolyngbyaceae cyanobacterium RM2_2_4]NJO75346.1 type II toxin-antitoxin system VapC family toxin [Leptolyngbyaceae cyanobacterium RM1_406_9]